MHPSNWEKFITNLVEHPFLRNILKMWYNRAKRANDPFEKFVYIWISFEAFTSNYTEEDWPRNVKRKLKRDSMLQEMYLSLLKIDPYLNEIIHLQELCPIYDTRKNHLLDEEWAVHFPDINNFSEAIEVLYKIRNNLFHGGKRPDSKRDVQLVKLAFKIVNILLLSVFDKCSSERHPILNV